MTGPDHSAKSRDQVEKLNHRRQVIGVLYRILLIAGALAFPLVAILIIFTPQFRWWAIFFPAAILLVGTVLAQVEYTLYKRLSSSPHS